MAVMFPNFVIYKLISIFDYYYSLKFIKMKRLLLTAAAYFFLTAMVNAQTTFSIAGNVGGGTFSGGKLAAGGDVQVDIPATTGLKITASAGYQNYAFKYGTVSDHFSLIPLLAGAKFTLASKLYGHAQLGYGVSTKSGGGGDFAYAPSIGYMLGKKLDLALKYISVGDVNAIVARLALGLF